MTNVSQSWAGKYHRLAIVLFVINAISALLFIAFVDRIAYDDHYNITDVHRYARDGVSAATIRAHMNAAGPTSFVWMAAAVRIFPADELRSARIAVLISWLLLGAGILIGARYTRFPLLWYAAFFVTLAFPHAASAEALVLTEGPALLFAILGTLLWVEFLSRPTFNLSVEQLGIAAGVWIGLAITCRQYYLALLPAMVVFALHQCRERIPGARSALVLPTILSLLAVTLPVLLLVFLWQGLSSPGMAPGNAYHHRTAIVGMNFYRPVVAAFYIGLYSLPLTFPAMLRLRSAWRWRAILISVSGGIVATHFMSSLLQPGPFNSLIATLSHAPRAQSLFFGFVVGAVVCNFVAVCLLLWEQRTILLSSPLVLFSILVIVFFVVEQLGIQGNIFFYDRYVIQVAPFLGIIAFGLLPELNSARLVALGAMSLVGQSILWRYALIR